MCYTIAIHDGQVCADCFREVRLVDDEQVALRDAGAALARYLVTARNVNDLNHSSDER